MGGDVAGRRTFLKIGNTMVSVSSATGSLATLAAFEGEDEATPPRLGERLIGQITLSLEDAMKVRNSCGKVGPRTVIEIVDEWNDASVRRIMAAVTRVTMGEDRVELAVEGRLVEAEPAEE